MDRRPDLPAVFCLHYLGGSAAEWTRVADLLRERCRIVALDLPGFGDAAASRGYSVTEMADVIAAEIAARGAERWMIVGHSMGAKVAAAIARRAEDGDAQLSGLIGVVTVAGSPPSPEPMDEGVRAQMLAWFADDDAASRAQAEKYVANNSTSDLDTATTETAIGDVLRMNRAAWTAWLEHGSREDWSARIGVLHTPALVIAGSEDPQLGPDAQQRLTAPHYTDVRCAVIPHAKHLLPLETPRELARLIAEHLADIDYRAMIASVRVSSGTRAALMKRGVPDDPQYRAQAIGDAAFAVLRAVVERVVPQEAASHIDLAARIDAELANGAGDGWRYADLPPDADAYRAALLTLDAAARTQYEHPFADLEGASQDALLQSLADRRFTPPSAAENGATFNAAQMNHWFEELRADATRHFVSHPQTLARMGYSGSANGGDGLPKSGFVRIGYGEHEAWEPVALADTAS